MKKRKEEGSGRDRSFYLILIPNNHDNARLTPSKGK